MDSHRAPRAGRAPAARARSAYAPVRGTRYRGPRDFGCRRRRRGNRVLAPFTLRSTFRVPSTAGVINCAYASFNLPMMKGNAVCMTAPAPATDASKLPGCSRSAATSSNWPGSVAPISSRCWHLSFRDGSRTVPRTVAPRERSSHTTHEPTYPDAPVTTNGVRDERSLMPRRVAPEHPVVADGPPMIFDDDDTWPIAYP